MPSDRSFRPEQVVRTPEANFEGLADFPFEPQYLDLDGLRMHYVDEGPRHAPVALLVHGMPTWSYLYRSMIPPLVAAGFRCVAPDHIGFGRSDKVTDPSWYDLRRHREHLGRLIVELDLTDITLVVQDWGGPIGLAQYAALPNRFNRLVIMNTWLDHDGYEYSPGIRQWIRQNLPGGVFRDAIPSRCNWGTLLAIGTSRVSPADSLYRMLAGEEPLLGPEAADVVRAYDAPFLGLGEGALAGPRAFPLSIPVHNPVAGDAEGQRRTFAAVAATELPVHFIWGVLDDVFTRGWGEQWHGMIAHATWHPVEARHFLQDTHGAEIAAHLIGQLG